MDRDWDGSIVGRRDARLLPGGRKLSPVLVRIPNRSVNNIPSRMLP